MTDRRVPSENARELLRLHFEGGSLNMASSARDSLPGRTVEDTREAYRELVRVGLMDPLHTFAWGRDSHYRLTKAAVDRRDEWFSPKPVPIPTRRRA